MDPKGKVAIVTGAAMGVGKGIARQLAGAGARVVIADINEEVAEASVDELRATGGDVEFAPADVRVDSELRDLITGAPGRYGSLDILVNNAGIRRGVVFPEAGPELWSGVLHVFLRQVMYGTQLALKAMQERGGAVVNIGSQAGIGFGYQNWPEYAAAKAGVIRFTSSVSRVAAAANVRVNAVCPGWVATESVREYIKDWTPEQIERRQVPDPMLKPEDIGDSILQFVRDDSLASRVMLHYLPGERKLVPVDAEY
jgi:NAD(P)-dependent dehydrogenase (short-subunit alcohol dehydrogenase family)